jgi:hypothetical protein
MDQGTGITGTTAPSESILANAAMEHLCQTDNWSLGIRALAEDDGSIDKGLKGELYSRFTFDLGSRVTTMCLLVQASLKMPTFTVQQFLIDH